MKLLSKPKNSEERKQKDWLGKSIVGTLIIQGANLFFIGVLSVSCWKIAHQKAPSLVQLSNGDSITVRSVGNLHREPENIQKFVKDILGTTLTWTGMLTAPSGEIPKKDSGEEVENLREKHLVKIATAAWEGSFAIAVDFRQEFLSYLAEITPPQIFNGTIQVVFLPINIQDPIPIGEGKWQVNIVADWLFINGKQTQKIIPFNKKVFVRAVEPPEFKGIPPGSVADAIANIRASGLEIYQMEDLTLQ